MKRTREEQEKDEIFRLSNTPNLHLIELKWKLRGDRERLYMTYFCDKCGQESSSFAIDIKNNYTCKFCGRGPFHLNLLDFKKWLSFTYNNSFELVNDNEYIDNKSRVHIRCKECGFIFYPSVTTLKRPRKAFCPKCRKNRSNGEIYIDSWLTKNKILFFSEKNFDWLPSPYLRYDFFIPEKKLIIEYDGEQHIRATDFWGGKEGLKKRKENDEIKNKYAIENGFSLLRISYLHEKKISVILKNLFGSTTIPNGSKGQILEASNFLKDDIV